MILIVRNEVKRTGKHISMQKMYEYFGGKGIVGVGDYLMKLILDLLELTFNMMSSITMG